MPLETRRRELARADELEIWLFMATDNVTAADRILDRLDEAVRMLAEFPDAGRERDELTPGLRSYAVEGFVLYYAHDRTRLEVVRVLSARRNVTRALFK
jgi:toxin ParE1/3/4